ncbi:MAG: hypothetical protein HC808_00075 [Candidatus Competibacteraceae bacterium]|nr:hypothetical protein [Candidatus Competibacteraceae bacterium]
MVKFCFTKKSGLALALLMTLAFGITGCGGGDASDAVISDGSDHGGGDDDFSINSLGRLALTEAESSAVRIVNLDDRSMLATFSVAGTPSSLYSSPGYRYAVVVQRNDDQVNFIDGGLYTEDHVDHLHDYAEMPQMQSLTLPDHRPTHFQKYSGQAVLFFDGSDTAASARLAVLDDAAIGEGSVEYVERDNNMHGAAQVIGDHLFVTYRDASVTDTTLPSEVEHHQRQPGGMFVFQKRYAEQCPRLHGSAGNASHVAFGCGDGVLLIQHNAVDQPAQHLANADSMEEDQRIGTVAGHPEVVEFVGIAGPGLYDGPELYAINPMDGGFRAIMWGDGSTHHLTHAFDRHGERFLVLDDSGVLHILSPQEDWAVRASVAVLERTEESPRPRLVVSGAGDYAYVSDPETNRVIEVNLENAMIEGEISLDFSPANLVWLGLTRHDNHDHGHDDHDHDHDH